MSLKISNSSNSVGPQQRNRVDFTKIDSSKTVDGKVSNLFEKRPRSLDDLDLAAKAKKKEDSKRLAHLDLASKGDPTKKDLGADLAFSRSMDIIALSGLISSTVSDASDATSFKVVKKTEQYFSRKRVEANTIYKVSTVEGRDIALLKQKNVWKKYAHVAGAFNIALMSGGEVVKIGKNKDVYEREQDRLDVIYSRIGNSCKGIQKRIKDSEKPELFKWSSSNNIKIPVNYHKEYRYRCDMLQLINNNHLNRVGRMKVYHSLASGSKTFIQRGIYHLDTKLENIGYLGEGRAEHFDFGGSVIVSEDGRTIDFSKVMYANRILPHDSQTLQELFKGSNINNVMYFLEKTHVFQLGFAFFELSIGQASISPLKNLYLKTTDREDNLRKLLELQREPDELRHREMILKMLSENAEHRPNIDQVEWAFRESGFSAFSIIPTQKINKSGSSYGS